MFLGEAKGTDLHRPFFVARGVVIRRGIQKFVILLLVRFPVLSLLFSVFALTCLAESRHLAFASQQQVSLSSPPAASAQSAPQQSAAPATTAPASPAATAVPAPQPQRAGLNLVVLDPAHGGTDPGARGTGGIRESEIVLSFAAQVARALEAQGFQVLETRSGNDNPSFDDRSAMANAQRGAVFVSLHVASTGLPGTVRVYTMSDMNNAPDKSGLIPWDRAQVPYSGLSKKLGNLVQGQLALRFKGSPTEADTAAIRQLRTTAAPAIAVEVSSVIVNDRSELDKMAPGLADAIARGMAAFRPSYVTPTVPGVAPGGQP